MSAAQARALGKLARPTGGAALLVYPLVGYGFALWDLDLDAVGERELGLVLAAWFVLSAGTMWLNASLDGDEGGALFVEGPPPPRPRHLARWGLAALASAVGLSSVASPAIFALCVACAALSILYSHPRTRWKAHPVLGPAVNALGYGLVSPLAGYVAVGRPPSARAVVVLACMALWTVGATFAAQAFQRADDARRGYRTFVVTHGPRACLAVCRATTWAPVIVLAAMAIAGYLPRILLVGCPFFLAVDGHLRRWMREPEGGSPRWAMGYMTRMLAGGLLFVSLATADFLYDYFGDRPAGGAATARGAPRTSAP